MKVNPVILSSDTPHHRYFINSLVKQDFIPSKIFFETEHVKPPFEVGPFFDKEQDDFEHQMFFGNTSYCLEQKYDLVESVNSDFVLGTLKEKEDIGIVFGTGIIRKPLINRFKYLINIHRGVASEYRGLDSDLWAIYHGDFNNIGVTVHAVDEQLDTGKIYGTRTLQLSKEMKIYHLRYHTTLMATEMIIRLLGEFGSGGEIYGMNQDRYGRYYSFMPLVMKTVVAKKFEKHVRTL